MGAGSNRILLAAVCPRSTHTLSSVTFTPNGGSATAMVLVGSQITNGFMHMYLYALTDADVNLGTGVGVITTTYSSGPDGLNAGIIGMSWLDAAQTTTLDSLTGNNNGAASATSISTTVTSAADDAAVFDFFYVRNTQTFTEGAGQTVQASLTGTNNWISSTEAAIATGGGTATLSRSWTSSTTAVQYAGTIAPYVAPTGYTLTATGAALTLTGYAATLTAAPTIVLDPATTYQTMRGWEVTAQAGDQEPNASLYLDQVIELGAQYGVDAVRLEIKDEWETSDGVYDWSFWDSRVPDFVLPFKEALARHGRALHLNLCYVAFGTHSGLHTTAANYADFILAGVQYLDTTFGLVPDTIEIILEPDNGPHLNTGTEIGDALKATGDLLATNGYTPGFIVPSALNMGTASTLYDTVKGVSGAASYITMLSYHRYAGVSDPNLAAILSRVNADGVESGMLEWLTANAETLWADLTKANVSMWQQYVLAFPTSDNGDQLFPIISNVPTVGSRTHGLAQYFKYVRRGAERIATSSLTTNVRPVAFVNPDGRYAVIVHADATGTYTVGPLPTGSYYVTRSSTTASRTPLGMVTVGGDGLATLSLNSGDIATLAPIEGAAGGRLRLSGGTANLTIGGGIFTPRGLWFTR